MPHTHTGSSTRTAVALEILHILAVLVVTGWIGFQAIDAGLSSGFVQAWCIGLGSLVAAPRFPAVGLFGFVALVYGMPRYDKSFFHMAQLGVPNWLCALAATGAMVWMVRHRRWPAPPHWVAWLMLVFIAWLGVAMVAALADGQPWRPHFKHHPQQYAQALVMFLLAGYTLADPGRSWQMALAVGGAVCVRAMLAGREGVYLEGDLSALTVIAIPLVALGGQVIQPRQAAWVFVLLGAGLVWVLSLTYNRAAAVGFVVMLAVVWIQAKHKWRALAVALPVLLIGGVLFFSSGYWQRFTGIWERTDDRNSVDQRLMIWEAGWAMFRDHPLTGVGPGNFHNHVQRYQPKLPEPFAAHNNFVSVLAESGAPGLVLYVALFAGALVALWRLAWVVGPEWPGPAAKMLIASLAAYLTVGLFISRQDMVLAYLLLGWAAAVQTDLFGPRATPPGVGKVRWRA